MIHSPSLPEIFIQTLAEMVREDRADKALLKARQATADAVQSNHRQRQTAADSDIPVDQFTLFHGGSSRRDDHADHVRRARPSFTRNAFFNVALG